MRTLFLAMFFVLSGTAVAEDADRQAEPVLSEIPIEERAFVDNINKFEKNTIVQQFGEPSKKNDIRHGTTGEVIASIWQYHFLNTSEDGSYYETTELDFIGNKVVMVVFMNHNGEEVEATPAPGMPAPLPEVLPEL